MDCLLFSLNEAWSMRLAGVHRIAHTLRKQDLDVEVFDWGMSWSLEQLQEVVRSRSPEKLKIIGFSYIFNHQWSPTMETFAGWIRKTYPHITLLCGGGHYPVFKSEHIQYYVYGFGEHAVQALIKYIISNGSRPRFELNKFNNGYIIDANKNYPAYPMSSLLTEHQDRDFIDPDEWLSIELSRGCKFKCSFCNFPVIGVKGDYTRDAEDFRQELAFNYDKFGTKNYIITDDTFNDSTEKITKFANVVETLDFDPFFSGFIRADLLISRGEKEMRELDRMNFRGQFYGVESFNTASAKSIGKGMSGERVKQGLIDIRKYFESRGSKQYRGSISLIAGLPHETVDTLMSTKQWLIDNWQGQCFFINVLEIPKAEWGNPSTLSVDFKEFGYTDMLDESPDNVDLQKNLKRIDPLLNATRHSTICMVWKNQHLDFIQAADTVADMIEIKKTHNFTISNFLLGMRFNDHTTLEDRLKITDNDLSVRKQELRYNSLDSYIHKKLSL